jgi:flagellar hook-basal body complex protein FliE
MATGLQIENLTRSISPDERYSQIEKQMEKVNQSVADPNAGPTSGKTFGEILEKSLSEVNLHQHQADTAIKEFVAGKSKNIHETMLALEKADTSLKMAMQVRNKILDAYREIMRMQV